MKKLNEINSKLASEKSSFRIKSFNEGTLFMVVDEYEPRSDYYKTVGGASRMLKKVRTWSGEI